LKRKDQDSCSRKLQFVKNVTDFLLKKNRKLKSQHSQFADSGGNMVGDTGGYLFTI